MSVINRFDCAFFTQFASSATPSLTLAAAPVGSFILLETLWARCDQAAQEVTIRNASGANLVPPIPIDSELITVQGLFRLDTTGAVTITLSTPASLGRLRADYTHVPGAYSAAG